jgi:hypothetical protein
LAVAVVLVLEVDQLAVGHAAQHDEDVGVHGVDEIVYRAVGQPDVGAAAVLAAGRGIAENTNPPPAPVVMCGLPGATLAPVVNRVAGPPTTQPSRLCGFQERNALRANLVERAEEWRWGRET